MTDLRTEAALLTDVLVERLSALRGATRTAAEMATETATGAAAGPPTPTGTPTTDGGGAAVADPVCPTCGHDATRTDCAGCPVCAVLAVLRGDRPELTAALLDGAITAVTAIRTLLDSTARPATSSAGTSPPGTATDPHPAEPVGTPEPGPRRSERISIR